MDGVTSTGSEERKIVMVLASTNRPWDLDEALIRRLERRICKKVKLIKKYLDIPLPSEKGRKELFKIYLSELKIGESIVWERLVSKTDGYSGADIANVCREAAMLPMRRKLKEEGGFKRLAEIESGLERLQGKMSGCF